MLLIIKLFNKILNKTFIGEKFKLLRNESKCQTSKTQWKIPYGSWNSTRKSTFICCSQDIRRITFNGKRRFQAFLWEILHALHHSDRCRYRRQRNVRVSWDENNNEILSMKHTESVDKFYFFKIHAT